MNASFEDAGSRKAVRPQSHEGFPANNRSVAPHAHALHVIQGEQSVREFLDQLRARHADADELALIAATLQGAEVQGFCILIKALRGGVA